MGVLPKRTVSQTRLPDVELLSQAQGFLDGARRLREVFGDDSRGSNNWVVSGAKTASGAPLLANDPHLSLPSPPLFWYSHLNTKRAGGNLDVEGISLVGVPGIILGFNDRIAWGSTTANHDVTDVYEENITAGQSGAPDTVLFKGQQVPIEIITETIKVAGKPDVVLKLENVPHHGVIIPTIQNGAVVPRTASKAFSVRWTGNDVSSEVGGVPRAERRGEPGGGEGCAAEVPGRRPELRGDHAGGRHLLVHPVPAAGARSSGADV